MQGAVMANTKTPRFGVLPKLVRAISKNWGFMISQYSWSNPVNKELILWEINQRKNRKINPRRDMISCAFEFPGRDHYILPTHYGAGGQDNFSYNKISKAFS